MEMLSETPQTTAREKAGRYLARSAWRTSSVSPCELFFTRGQFPPCSAGRGAHPRCLPRRTPSQRAVRMSDIGRTGRSDREPSTSPDDSGPAAEGRGMSRRQWAADSSCILSPATTEKAEFLSALRSCDCGSWSKFILGARSTIFPWVCAYGVRSTPRCWSGRCGKLSVVTRFFEPVSDRSGARDSRIYPREPIITIGRHDFQHWTRQSKTFRSGNSYERREPAV